MPSPLGDRILGLCRYFLSVASILADVKANEKKWLKANVDRSKVSLLNLFRFAAFLLFSLRRT